MAKTLSVSLLTLLLGLPAFLAPSIARAGVPEVERIAMVELQRVINDTAAGKKSRTELERSVKGKQEKFDKKRVELETAEAKLGSLPKDQQAPAFEKLQREAMELQSMAMTLQQEVAAQEARMLEKIYANCQVVVGEIAKEQKLDLVIVKDQTTVLYSESAFDITNDVIKRYDKKY